jgi:hypothetical protein
MDSQVTRRTLLAGAGVAAAAATIGTFATTAGAQADGSGGFSSSASDASGASLRPAALTAGLTYLPVDPTLFEPINSNQVRLVTAVNGTSITTPPGGLMAPVVVPVGSVLKEITFAYFSTAGTLNLALWKKGLTTAWNLLAPSPPTGLNLPNGPATQTATFTLTETVDGTSTYMILMNNITTTAQSVHGLLIGYAPPALPPVPPAYVAASPIARVLDTRTTGGKLGPDEERIISLGVPGSVNGAVINLTITETEGAGFVAVFPADVAYPGNSSINWSAPNENIANGVITAVDPTGKVKIRGGVNPTHVVIDVLGALH